MPLYFFDIIDNGKFSQDEFGVELDSLDEAREQAQALLPDLARDKLPDGDRHSFVCQVRDGRSRLVYRGRLIYQGELVEPDRLGYLGSLLD